MPAESDRYQQEAGCKREILQEVPEQLAALALAGFPEVAGFPEPLEQHRSHRTIAGHDERREPVRHPGQDAERHDELDEHAG